MIKSKILINIENLSDLEEYKKIGYNNFLFAVKDYSIGYTSFNLHEIVNIECNKYLLINRIFNTEDIDNLKKIIPTILKFDGIIFEDVGVYNILKDYDINLIWNQTHFATNYSSINYWTNLVSSAVISNELTLSEVKDIIMESNSPLVLNVFGKNPIMYSRRTLLSNFNKYFNLKENHEAIIRENITKNEFLIKETNKGTIYFNNDYFNLFPYIKNFNDSKVLYYLIYPGKLNYKEIDELVITGEYSDSNDGFMNKKTIYKLGDKRD